MNRRVARSACVGYFEHAMVFLIHRAFGCMLGSALVMLVMGCASSKRPAPGGEENVSSTSSSQARTLTPLQGPNAKSPSCGREVLRHGEGHDDAARTCLWDAYLAKKPASLVIVRHTIEGDAVMALFEVQADGSVQVSESSDDRFGSSRGLWGTTCTSLERSPEVNGHRGFIARGCAGERTTFEVP